MVKKVKNTPVKTLQYGIEICRAFLEDSRSKDQLDAASFCFKEMVWPEVIAHEKKQIGSDDREQPFCVVFGVGGQVEDGGSIRKVFPGL